MAYQQSKHIFQGMNRDLSEDKQKGTFYIDAHNIRITAREDTTLLSVTNEKGNSRVILSSEDGDENNRYTAGQYIGHAVLGDYLILFTKETIDNNYRDTIWRINLKAKTSKLLYSGSLNFSPNNPIETLVDYETDKIQKVYWTDGVEQPRVINIIETYTYTGSTIDSQFDFVPEVYPDGIDTLQVTVDKINETEGIFAAGTIQYFISYIGKLGQESNIVWQSSLYYPSPLDRGGSPSETVSNSFRITIDNPTKSFDYLRIYSVQHTSEDTDLIAKKIIELPIDTHIEFIDTGIIGETINAADLYYKGGVPIAVGTMSSKDQTLFLGNIEIKNKEAIPEDIVNTFRNEISTGLVYTDIPAFEPDLPENLYYSYKNQLKYNSAQITTFKARETYRFGVQFQDKWGRWSEPVFLKDLKNSLNFPYQGSVDSDPKIFLTKAKLIIGNDVVISTLKNEYHYVKVRPLIVFPAESERECIAQGVLCPTVYNVQDRLDNSPYAQPSWFFRPYWPNSFPYEWTSESDDTKGADFGTLLPYAHNGLILGGLSMHGEIEKSYSIQGYYTKDNKIRISKGRGNYDTQHNFFPNNCTVYEGNKEKDLTQINDPKNFYYIDQSLVTLNSPEIDFGDILSTEGLSFRVVGALNVTGCYGTMYLNTKNSPNDFWKAVGSNLEDTLVTAQGFYKKDIAIKNYNNSGIGEGWRIFGNGPYWLDVPYYDWGIDYGELVDSVKPYKEACEFIIYPWQSTGSLGGGSFNMGDVDVVAPFNGELKQKVISNLRYSPETVYLSTPINYGTSDIQFTTDTSDTVITKIPEGFYYKDTSIKYYGSIDKLLYAPEHVVDDSRENYNENYGFDVIVANRNFTQTQHPTNQITAYKVLREQAAGHQGNSAEDTPKFAMYKKYTATSITYRSMPHAIITLDTFNANTINILPSVNDYGSIPEYRSDPGDMDASAVTGDHNLINKEKMSFFTETFSRHRYKCVSKSFWQTDDAPTDQYVMQGDINVNFKERGGILLVGEIYRPEELITNKFGGTSDYAIQQNVWIPAGDSINLDSNVEVSWNEGDTYYQRYDCLKTYPYSKENENGIVEILSFMCETRINIAGRYDKNRGLIDNTYITNENFNLINKGYTQKDNFFSYKILDERFNINKFKTQITWTKSKTPSAIVDNWTNVTLANTLDLDGDRGEVVSLNRYKNDIIAFQYNGISQIIYNPNVQINTASGLPIELANSGKVQGKRYLYENVGCQNKWSINDEMYGSLYFVDNFSKGIYKLGEQGLVCLTDNKGFRAWMEQTNSNDVWLPYLKNTLDDTISPVSNSFRTFYDKTFKDVYFINSNTCLVYSDLLDQFVSFMDYQGTNCMVNIGNNFYAVYNSIIWEQFSSFTYNNIYEIGRDSDITFIDNLHPEMNKIFTNLEYRSDVWDASNGIFNNYATFDTVRIYDEYQDSGEVPINMAFLRPMVSDLQRKFRVWRIQLPRDKHNPLDRINNTWAKITLKYSNQQDKIILHDAVVGYYI